MNSQLALADGDSLGLNKALKHVVKDTLPKYGWVW